MGQSPARAGAALVSHKAEQISQIVELLIGRVNI
jgi:hypothetical protein